MKYLMLFSCIFLVRLAESTSSTAANQRRLSRAFASPLNVDSNLDCAIKELAWEYAKKLLPRYGNNQLVYDALQLGSCKVLPDSGRKYAQGPLKNDILDWIANESIVVFVDPEVGSDDNPGTSSQPVKTIRRAVLLIRMKRDVTAEKGIIYLNPGHYFPTTPIDLTPEDSNLAIIGQSPDSTFISGARNYSFNWNTYLKKMAPVSVDVSIINNSVDTTGKSNSHHVKFISKVGNASDCQTACGKDPSCFAFTWYDGSFGDLSNMCYFRTDALWAPTRVTGATSGRKVNILVADLSGQDPTPFSTLFLNGRRAVRARYPNGNPETMGLHTDPSGYTTAVKWLPHNEKPPAKEIHIDSPQRNRSHFPQFLIGLDGPVDVFDPPESYWGTSAPVGGGGSTYRITTGLVYSSDEEFATRSWKNPKTGVVHAFHCHYWGNWQFAVDDRIEANNTIKWSYGGFQEARGCDFGQEWYIENIFEELDAPGEWFYDTTEQKLYLFPNGTDNLPSNGFGTTLQRLLNIRGTVDSPVYNITLMNITFTQTEPTYFESHEVPSGGDWAIHRGGAVFVEGVDGFTMQKCLFDSPGGNGLFLSKYIRNTLIEANEFRYAGDTAIAAVGSTDLIDGTNGNQPRGTLIIGNLVHESGIFGKQTSPYMQSLACVTTLIGNVFFNGPRAGINFNDGFGGGNFLMNNLIFNMVRETGDHGAFNSWDRQPYLTTVQDVETPSLIPATSYIMRNFLINNYHSTWPIDHDDGSCYWEDAYNYLVYGGYKNFLGHSKTVMYNVYVYPDAIHSSKQTYRRYPYCANHDGATLTVLPSGWDEVWARNKCIIGNPDIYSFGTCSTNAQSDSQGLVPLTYDNEFYAPNKEIYIHCGTTNLTLQEYQAMGFDKESVVNDIVDTATVIDWGKQLLDL